MSKDLKHYLTKKIKLDPLYIKIESDDMDSFKKILDHQGLTKTSVIRALIKKYIADNK